MSDQDRNPLKKQQSTTSLEKSLQMISPPQQAPVTIYPGPSAGISNLSKADLEIAQRLQNLRQSHMDSLPTEEEMASRLAHLKGLPADHYTKPQGAIHQPPDTRTQAEKADGLLSQVMDELALEASVPNPDDELETRLARLRGEESRRGQAQGAMALPSSVYLAQPQARAEATLGEDLDDMSMDEVEALMKATEKEVQTSAEKALGDLQADPELAGAVAQATRKKEKKDRQKKSKGASGGKGCSSDEERHSKSFDSDLEIEGGKAIDPVTEQEEVQRIIDMYTKRAQLKKEKKRKKKEAAAAAMGGAVGGDDSDSDIEVSSASDLTSESEKFSLSDELSD
nr:abscission/NoCut checkpoint regulator-like [Procambarus clarkii]XP_045600823.1 abscission/NoCut checkpoint regulator-like [Procambarus clarkii]XP_045600824.1 abscission/NoCut checkpoint regulator-like [Procambarus clarkii]XP_045600825.1 abscission/NoCut checkpoint regulator-like [Procambarus clarkii]